MNFDNEINRYGTNSLKYDFKIDKNKPEDVLPMWVADMDFRCCEEILNDMHKKIDHGIFGYSKNDEKYFNAIREWYLNNFNIELKKDWLITTPVVGFALATAIKILTEENDDVLIIEKKLMKKFPKDKWSKLHHQLVLFGRYKCKAMKPECKECKLKGIC